MSNDCPGCFCEVESVQYTVSLKSDLMEEYDRIKTVFYISVIYRKTQNSMDIYTLYRHCAEIEPKLHVLHFPVI